MREKLLVNEVAKLLNVSSHTIRYYDKEGLLTSENDEDSGYRLFDMDDVLRLSNVILLRDSGIPIKEIKSLIHNYSSENYKEKLQVALNNLQNERAKINQQENMIHNILNSFEEKTREFKIVKHKDVKYRFIRNIGYQEKLNSIECLHIFDELKDENINYLDLTYELKQDCKAFMIEDFEKGNIIIPAGEYIEYTFVVSEDKAIEKAVEAFYQHAEDKRIFLDEKIYLTIKPHGMLVVDNGYIAILFAKVKQSG